ncbi:DUF2793 domain-containing protein [Pseudomonas sp. R2.Fl]|nr:DUF2793 domain-containing protein [Pseudomonas sp. R2.Fl]
MSETTPNIGMPYLMPAQAQKHVTHNEALQRLDAVTQLVLTARLSEPPETPEQGQCFAVAAGASGTWAGMDGRLAVWLDGAWHFIEPKPGWRAFLASEEEIRVFRDGEWTEIPLPANGSFLTLGVSTTADATNRLAVSSPASLFTHAGGDHRLVVNKQAEGDTAALLFQTDWQGRAEIGLTGSDALVFKVSPDGGSWATALEVQPSGVVKLPRRPIVQAALTVGAHSPAPGTQTGFDTLAVDQGGFSLGAAVPGGVGNRLNVPVSGIYAIGLSVAVIASSSHTIRILRNGSVPLAVLRGKNSSGVTNLQAVTAIADLNAGDWLSLDHAGDPQIDFSAGNTSLQAHLL